MGCDFDHWETSVRVNFLGHMEIVHQLWRARNVRSAEGPGLLFFAGGGTNNAPTHYSAYIVSKIALIKMCELLDAENGDARFAIVGPGWVKTKIHESTLRAGQEAGSNYQRTLEKLAGNECTPMDRVLDFCDWVIRSPRNVVSGRNFSVVYDPWESESWKTELIRNPDMYKLRRQGNDWRENP
jgi:NAD(P)-dependent dehydrogenase (short-subunit alcohol dehydrogenase family)